MKRGLLILSILFFSLLIIPFAIADETDDKINKAYECLEGKVHNKCSSLSSEERIFSLLAIEECKNEVISDSKNDECWPKSNCKIKTTAQAILALDKINVDTSKAEDWLFSQNTTPLDIVWYLEIESTEATTCTITYSGSSYTINIGADKKINQGAGSCLSLSDGAWWLKISSSCYAQEFEISCDKGFLTTLLYQKPPSSTIYVSEETHSASGEEGSSTTEKINSFCFARGTSCDYEGSLWAALVLDYLGYDVFSYLPYLVTIESENTKYLPESFLYTITADTVFRSSLLSKQISNKYWKVSDDRFYDTALALFPFQYEEPQEKTNAKNWLLEVQDNDGCWQGNIRNTAFILYSIWPGYYVPTEECGNEDIEGNEECDGSNLNDETCVSLGYDGGSLSCYAPGTENQCTFNKTACTGLIDCEDAGYSCMLAENCSGTILDDYLCLNEEDICCDELGRCADKNGIICAYDETCTGEMITNVSDLSVGEECCLTGYCEPDADGIDCDDAGYYCMSSMSCEEAEGEEKEDYYCFGINICCTKSKLSKRCVEDLNGEICNLREDCVGGDWEEASDLHYGEKCCVGGKCEGPSALSECELYGGICRTSCEDDEEENTDECDYSSDVCCVEKTIPPDEKGYWWIWVLLSLIVLTLLGIIFRDKLRPFWLRIKKSKPPKPGFFMPSRAPKRLMPRRILPPTQRPAVRRPISKPRGEIDDVLKKLKEMGK